MHIARRPLSKMLSLSLIILKNVNCKKKYSISYKTIKRDNIMFKSKIVMC